MAMNIVTNSGIISVMRQSRYFRINLGLVQTVEKNGSRSFHEKDKFSFFYNNLYRTTIFGQGNVGDIKFYTDHYIREEVLAVYYGENFEEFIFQYDPDFVRENGVDAYLGKILKECEDRYEELKRKNELKKLEEKPKGNPSKVLQNPGQVSWEDLKAYMEEKRRRAQL
jgi:hypothetical protein